MMRGIIGGGTCTTHSLSGGPKPILTFFTGARGGARSWRIALFDNNI
jgi:hypothetical protein